MREFLIQLDRPRRLAYDFDAWDRIAERYKPKGDASFGPAELLNFNISARDIPFLIYAGVAWQDQEITEAQVKALLNTKIQEGKITVLDAMNTVIEAIFAQAGLKKVEGTTEDKAKDKEPPTKKAPAPRPQIPGSRKKER